MFRTVQGGFSSGACVAEREATAPRNWFSGEWKCVISSLSLNYSEIIIGPFGLSKTGRVGQIKGRNRYWAFSANPAY